MNDFNDPYGILALNAMKDLAEECNLIDKNTCMEEDFYSILPTLNPSFLIQKWIKIPIQSCVNRRAFFK